jgi:hypothetical protein
MDVGSLLRTLLRKANAGGDHSSAKLLSKAGLLRSF